MFSLLSLLMSLISTGSERLGAAAAFSLALPSGLRWASTAADGLAGVDSTAGVDWPVLGAAPALGAMPDPPYRPERFFSACRLFWNHTDTALQSEVKEARVSNCRWTWRYGGRRG
jgi:hypothetical protein